jgi:hypothetical protein
VAPPSNLNFELEGPTQNTVSAGLDLARRVVTALTAGHTVQLDLQSVERLTPSFANALVMTILEGVGPDTFSSRLRVRFGSEFVEDGWRKAVERYERGVRLTTQREGAA